MTVRLHRNAFGRWIILDAADPTRAWSGSRFVQVNKYGMGKLIQVSNFASEDLARRYAQLFGLEVEE